MEYAAGGELLERIYSAGRFSEDEARYFFQQLICGVSYCHFLQICHRDLKLENTLLDGSPAPRLKICDFGYSKSSLLHSRPKSTVGTPAYIAPKVLSRREYDGKATPRLSEDKVTQCVDARLNGEYPPKAVAKLAAVAALCVQYEVDFRPNMSIVVKALQPLLNARTGPPGEAHGL